MEPASVSGNHSISNRGPVGIARASVPARIVRVAVSFSIWRNALSRSEGVQNRTFASVGKPASLA